ncbi:MAG: hypothetical protein ACLR7K_14520 [Subdoligranulum sp.]
MDKNVTQTTLSNNYGDFLMDAVDNAKDQFTEEEYASLKADADKIREIENQITALPQDEATSQSAAEAATPSHSLRARTLMATALTAACLPTMRSPL